MTHHPVAEMESELSGALAQMVEALATLDRLKAPGDIGSHLDLAIARLEAQLGLESHAARSFETLLASLGPE